MLLTLNWLLHPKRRKINNTEVYVYCLVNLKTEMVESCFMVCNCVHANDNNGWYVFDIFVLRGCNWRLMKRTK